MKQPLKLTTRQGERIAGVAGLRTPFAKQATAFHGVPAVDLGKLVVSELLARTDLDPKLIDQLVFGQVVQMPEAPNIAREIVLGTGMSVSTDAYSVSRACATSFQAVANVTESIMAGTVDIAIAGGATVLSHFNDSGFWLVGRFLNMDVKTTLKTWTVMETLLGTIAFLIVALASIVF